MNSYKCNTCNKIFNRKWNLIRHENKKNPCTITPPTTANSTPPKTAKLRQIIKCNYCHKEFTRKDSLNKHLKSRCKIKKQIELDKEEIFQSLIKKVEQLEKQNNELSLTINNTNSNNTINNTQINNNNNIKLVAFGKEDMSFIVDEVSKRILNKGFRSVPVLTHYTHFDKNRPEYHNIYISNMRNSFIMIYDGKKWNLKNRNEVLDDLISNKTDYLIEQFDEFKDVLDESTLKKFGRFLNDQDEEYVINSIKDELKLILYNNRNLPLETKKQLGLENIS